MRICSFCAAYFREDVFVCPTCGTAVPPTMRKAEVEPLQSDEEPPALSAPRKSVDVESSTPRKAVEWGFWIGCVGMLVRTVWYFVEWWEGGEQRSFVGFIVSLLGVPLGGLFVALMFGMCSFLLGRFVGWCSSLFRRQSVTPPHHLLAKTDSMIPPEQLPCPDDTRIASERTQSSEQIARRDDLSAG